MLRGKGARQLRNPHRLLIRTICTQGGDGCRQLDLQTMQGSQWVECDALNPFRRVC